MEIRFSGSDRHRDGKVGDDFGETSMTLTVGLRMSEERIRERLREKTILFLTRTSNGLAVKLHDKIPHFYMNVKNGVAYFGNEDAIIFNASSGPFLEIERGECWRIEVRWTEDEINVKILDRKAERKICLYES